MRSLVPLPVACWIDERCSLVVRFASFSALQLFSRLRTGERVQAPEVTGVPTLDKSTAPLAKLDDSGAISSVPSNNPSRIEPQAPKVGDLHQHPRAELPDAVAITDPSIDSKSPTEAPEEIQGSQRAGRDEPMRLPAAAEIGVPATPRGSSPHVVIPTATAPLVELPSRPLPISKSDELPPALQQLPNEQAVVAVKTLPPQSHNPPG